MSEVVIRAMGLGKQYRIGSRAPYQTLREQLNGLAKIPIRLWRKRQRNQDPATNNLFWALKDVSFEVRRGEAVGIIGRNGAGKSTLLKILSRITEPTAGGVGLRGRIGSLLEVGTGFHPELTGRENIYLNGAILGMRRGEIARKFDEIVAFAEVEKFIDTPVKFFSSGMYTRLAFSVAAHLEPEILVVDEVLAVGDAAFQKKCLGRMSEVARGGRTVLFVSHNMQAVSQLTGSVLLLERGQVVFHGPTPNGVARYTAGVFGEGSLGGAYEAPPGSTGVHVAHAQIRTSDEYGEHVWGNPITFEFTISIDRILDGVCFAFQVLDELDRPVCYFWLHDKCAEFARGPGSYRVACHVPRFRLYMGRYNLKTYLADRRGHEMLEVLTAICPFEVTMRGIHREQYDWQPGATVYLEDGEWSPVEKRGGGI